MAVIFFSVDGDVTTPTPHPPPQKKKMDGTSYHACSAWCVVYRPFFQGILPSTEKLLQLMSKIKFDVDHTNGVTIDVANDVLPVWWMEVYSFRFSRNQNHYDMPKLNDKDI